MLCQCILCNCVFVCVCTCGVCVASSKWLLYVALRCGLSARGGAARFTLHTAFGHGAPCSLCPLPFPPLSIIMGCVPSTMSECLWACAAGVSVCVAVHWKSLPASIHTVLILHMHGTVYRGILCVRVNPCVTNHSTSIYARVAMCMTCVRVHLSVCWVIGDHHGCVPKDCVSAHVRCVMFGTL